MRAFELDDHINEFFKFCSKRLELKNQPPIVLSNEPLGSKDQPTFAHFNPHINTVTVYVAGRHIADILRSIAHELTHSQQHEAGKLTPTSGKTGSDAENESNATAGILMRDYAKLHPNLIS